MDASLHTSLPHGVSDTECKGAPGPCFYPSGLWQTHERTFHIRGMEGEYFSWVIPGPSFVTTDTIHGTVRYTVTLKKTPPQKVMTFQTAGDIMDF